MRIILGLFLSVIIIAWASSGVHALDCNVTKNGTMYVSPSTLQFYLSQEEMQKPDAITVKVGGYTEPEGNATNNVTEWGEYPTQFCWTATKSAQWLLINDSNSTVVSSTSGSGSFTVSVDPNQLFPYQDSNTTLIYSGNITIVSNLTNFATQTIPVTVYINAVREAGEMSIATTDWLDLTLKVPISYNQTGALYILVEHPTLAPGQVFAYRLDSDGNPTFTLFSEWGIPVSGAEGLYYSADVQNTPIAIPFSSDSNSTIYTVPYGTQTIWSTSPNIKAYIPVAFGKGLRMIGMEGDMIIRAVVGDPDDISNYSSWKELLYYVVHVYPITGDWVVTENFGGESFTYIDSSTGIVYPLVLREDRGTLSADWQTSTLYPATGFSLNYANSNDQICNTLAIEGHRFEVTSCAQKGGYDLYFSQGSIFGMIDYYYHIDSPPNPGEGYIEGTWQWRYSGWTDWSLPETFSAVKQEVEITPDPNDNLYYANGTYNGVGTQFIVDTGASAVIIQGDPNEFAAKGWNCDLANPVEVIAANGGTITEYVCLLDITLEDRITVPQVECLVSTSNAMNLLGDTFLSQIHVTIGADGHMILSK